MKCKLGGWVGSILPVFTADDAIFLDFGAEKGAGVIGVFEDGFVVVAAAGEGFDHGKVEMEADGAFWGAGPCALIAEECTGRDKLFPCARGKIWRHIDFIAIGRGHVGVIGPDLVAVGEFG